MNDHSILKHIWKARKATSEKCGYGSKQLIAFYKEKQDQHNKTYVADTLTQSKQTSDENTT